MSDSLDTLVAIVLAAGSARRFGRDKLFASLAGRPVLGWSLAAFQASPSVSAIVLVLPPDRLAMGRRLADSLGITKLHAICPGGARRQDSLRNGVAAMPAARWIAVHDGARPFVSPELVETGWRAAREVGAAVAAVPVKDTIKIVEADHVVARTPSRSGLWAAQTPQIVQAQQLLAAFAANGDDDVTDDAELLERAGFPVVIVPSTYDNLKITTPEDLLLARAIARRRDRVGGRQA